MTTRCDTSRCTVNQTAVIYKHGTVAALPEELLSSKSFEVPEMATNDVPKRRPKSKLKRKSRPKGRLGELETSAGVTFPAWD